MKLKTGDYLRMPDGTVGQLDEIWLTPSESRFPLLYEGKDHLFPLFTVSWLEPGTFKIWYSEEQLKEAVPATAEEVEQERARWPDTPGKDVCY